jgi:type III secretion protein J
MRLNMEPTLHRLLTRALCVGLLLTGSACQDATLYSQLTEHQANQMLRELLARGIEAQKVASEQSASGAAFAVHVPPRSVGQALAVLRAASLPSVEPPGLERILEQKSIVPSLREERVRTLAAISGELSRTLQDMPGVVTARVHIAWREHALESTDSSAVAGAHATSATAGATGESNAPKAAVYLRTDPAANVSEHAVRKLVSAAVQGLDPEHVTLIRTDASQARAASAAPTTARTPTPTTWVGPIEVANPSVPALRRILAVLLLANLGLAITLATTVYRHSRSK